MNIPVPNLSIVIPVYNEEKTVLDILNKVDKLKNFCELEVIIINDGSIDNTKKIIQDNPILYSKFINLDQNKGKGKAVIEGIKECTKDYIIIQDADLEYDPEDIKIFLEQIKKINYDVILGSRFIGNKRTVLNFWHMVGNKFITFLFNLINNTTFTDIYCCYCMFKRDLLDPKKLRSYGWGQQAEILTYLVNKESKLFEIGVNYNGRTYSEGKKIRYYDVFAVIYWILSTKIKKIFI